MNITTYHDPLELSIAIAQDRTKALVLWEMEHKKQEVTQFEKNIPSLSKQKIQDELSGLIELGLVTRVVCVKRKSQRIEYALTNRGAIFLKCLRKMMNIGIEIMIDFGRINTLIQSGYVEKTQSESDVV